MVANLAPDELRERLESDLPGAVVASQSSDQAQLSDMLATKDTVVVAGQIPAVARYLRDELGYAYLSNITVVDYLREDLFELVYHFFQLAGGSSLVIKTRVPRDAPVVPSLTPFWPGASLQEREAFDLFGIDFPGHPYLRRIYMWEEFEGFPMRKDFPKQGDKYLEDE